MDSSFITQWRDWLILIEEIVVSLGLLIILVYYIRMTFINDLKKKYDFINNHEISAIKKSSLLIIFGLALMLDNLLSFQFEIIDPIPFVTGVAVTLMLAVLVYLGVSTTLDIYYPKYLGKRLDSLRYTPRISHNGKKMKLLNEEEEDTYLTEEMQLEEKSLQFDYDVWIDQESGHTQIEKYDGHKSSLICPKCKYRTLRDVAEEMSNTDEGEEVLIRHYQCYYCNHAEDKEFKVSQVETQKRT